ncbi:transcriptional regulator FilR1 domain-containing protein [Haladaptatus sp. CMSO5]|uniref:transcriptional regulator FilR1 domain-containing protein n=1 Tax=Haladaptatus sp. CMSO5 TaxID=3120514 RepID=UPI002FCE1AD2
MDSYTRFMPNDGGRLTQGCENVTHNDRVATNPLTGERLVIRECISNLVDSARLDVLRTLDEQPMSPSAIHNRGLLTRQTASKHLTQFTERGLAKPAGDQGGYELTASGKLTLNALEDCLKEIDQEQLAALTRATHSLGLLQALSTGEARPRDLTDVAGSPSRATVQRALQTFETAGWTTTAHGSNRLTPAGERVLTAYDELAVTIEQVMEKAPWLQRLSPTRADVPAHALEEAKVVESGPDSPGIVLGAALNLCDPRLKQFRALTSIFNPTLFRAYDALLKLGLAGEAIVDKSVGTHLHEAGLEHFLDDSSYDNFQIFRLDEPLTLGIGLYDDRKVAIGSYNERGDGDHIAMLVSSDDALVKWGEQLYETYKAQARPALENSPGIATDATPNQRFS